MRIIVTGASGFIGKCFMKTLAHHETVGLCFSHPKPGLIRLDLRDKREVQAFFANYRPDAVIHCAAKPTVDWCEQNPEAARALNVEPTITLADECARLNATLAFVSTDYVFDGADGPYKESDRTNPINVYGKLKLEAEDEIQKRLDRYVIARTTNVYGFDLESKNFLMGILPRMASDEQIVVAQDQIGTPTLVTDFCGAIEELLREDATGVFHVAGPDVVNRVEWARAAAQRFEINPDLIVGAVTKALGQPAPRPLKAGLISERLTITPSKPLRNLAEGLDVMHADWGGTPPIAQW